MTRPIRMGRRLVAGSLLATALALLAGGWIAEWRVTEALESQHAAGLRAVLDVGARRAIGESMRPLRPGGPGSRDLRESPPPGPREIPAPDGASDGNGMHWLVRNAETGETLGRTAGFPDIRTNALDPEGTVEEQDRSTAGVYRIAGLRFEPTEDERAGPGPPRGRPRPPRRPGQLPPGAIGLAFEVYVADDIAEERLLVAFLRRVLIVCGVIAALTAGLLLWLNVRLGLRPIEELADRITGLEPRRLDEPLAPARDTVELRPIVEAVDGARAGLARAFERERRFTSDAAHELRTPLAGLRASLEVALRRERTVEKHREIASECLAVTCSMQDAVEALLLLARSESPDATKRCTVDLVEVLERALDARSGEFAARGLIIERPASEPSLSAQAHPALVERVVRNLVSNVAAHATENSTVKVRLGEGTGRAWLEVENACPPLPVDAAERATEPFWRADTARSGEGAHVGLGLAIARTAADALGGALLLATSRRDGTDRFTARFEIPLETK